jgi:hypothetical protein
MMAIRPDGQTDGIILNSAQLNNWTVFRMMVIDR